MNIFEDQTNPVLDGWTVGLTIAIVIVACLIVALSIVALIFSIKRMLVYLKYNKQMVKSGVIGKDCARELLDKHGLNKIKVVKASIFTAFMIGNSYSHWFKRVRLRGLIYNKASLTSIAIAGQKVGLARLDKEGDKDMKRRIWLPIVSFLSSWMFILLVAAGIILDLLFFKNGWFALISSSLGLVFYGLGFWFCLSQLKTEIKAQNLAIEMLKNEEYLTDEEIEDAKTLYHQYNIDYVISLLIALLEAILQALKIALQIVTKMNSSSSSSN